MTQRLPQLATLPTRFSRWSSLASTVNVSDLWVEAFAPRASRTPSCTLRSSDKVFVTRVPFAPYSLFGSGCTLWQHARHVRRQQARATPQATQSAVDLLRASLKVVCMRSRALASPSASASALAQIECPHMIRNRVVRDPNAPEILENDLASAL